VWGGKNSLGIHGQEGTEDDREKSGVFWRRFSLFVLTNPDGGEADGVSAAKGRERGER